MLFAAYYKTIQVLGLAEYTPCVVRWLQGTHSWQINGPRLIQALFSALTDLYTYFYALREFGRANSIEASFTMMGLYHWPAPRNPPASRREFQKALCFAALGCILRPTNVLIWVFMGGSLLAAYPHRRLAVLWDVARTGLFYGRWVFTQWEFLRVNVVEQISLFYGSHPFHWYFSQAIPLVLFTSLPFCLYGAYRVKHAHKRQLAWMCLVIAAALSFQGHKEFRFLLPLLAPMQIYTGRSLYLIQRADFKKGRHGRRSKLRQAMTFLVSTNLLLGMYFSRIHKRGVVDAVHYVREQALQHKVDSVLFLMPCHSAPFYSHIHINLPLRFITCEPPLG
ncbi:hypothetical protein HDU91_003265 [Kappamyces sp. JEL0680]|nr:hypothetical protein HDU91_003265 [Kappamyces sp. JEL0680]